MVVICDVPMLSTGVIQERVATPSTCTVQAPQSATPHPNFVPVMPSTSRSTQRRGVSPSTSTLWAFPLILIVKGMVASEMTFSQQIPTLMTGGAGWVNVSVSTALGLILTPSEVFDVFDQCALILIAQVVAVVVALVLDEVRAGVDFEEPLHHGRLPFRVIDDAQLVEFRLRLSVENSEDVGLQNGLHILRVEVHHEVDRRPLGHPQQIGVEIERCELSIERLQEREKVRKLGVG